MLLHLITSLAFATEAPLTTLKPATLGYTADVSEASLKAWEAAFKQLEQTNGATEGYQFPDRFDETLGGPWDTISAGCSWYCGGIIEIISASSSLPDSKSGSYTASNLHDSDVRTAWVEGKDDHGIGESITLKSTGASIDQIQIWNGYQKSAALYTQNSRPQVLKVYVNDTPKYLLALEDTRAVQYFKVAEIASPATLRFEIVTVYPGTKWQDTAISEINFDGNDVH